MAREMAGSLLNVLEAPRTGVMPTPADLLNITPMTSAPGLLFRAPAGALASGMARRGIGDNQGPALGPDPAEVSPLGFYSPTEQAVLNLKQTTLTPDQARASLANLGAKKEEMQWMGMDEFLANRTSVTQDELLDFVRQNRVNVEQVNYGGADPEALYRQADELMAEGQRVQASGDLDGARVLFDRHDDLQRRAEGLEASPQGLLAPKFSGPNLQTPGGENYREVVLTMPSRLVEIDPDGTMRDLRTGLPTTKREPFKGGHFPDENALAHVRMNDRIDADGKKVLFIEEIQSDWHQKGRRSGYREKLPHLDVEGQDRLERFLLLRSLYYDVRLGKSEPIKGGDPGLTKEYTALENEFVRYFPTTAAVPDAPFKQTWSDLSMKRIMQMAADEGYDRVAWTTGRQQADRYDLSKQISEIHYSGANLKAYDHNGATVINQTGIKESDLPDLIGKEAADKLLAQTRTANGSPGALRSLVGQDLKVGGEGMIKFYDQMLPKKAQKIARRLDQNAKVGQIKLRDRPAGPKSLLDGEPREVWSIDITPPCVKALQADSRCFPTQPQRRHLDCSVPSSHSGGYRVVYWTMRRDGWSAGHRTASG